MAVIRGNVTINLPDRPPSISRLTWTQNLLQSTLAAYVPPFGIFAQHDWPVPKGAIPGIALRTFHSLPTLIPYYVNFGAVVRRAERTTAKVATRADIARAERTTGKVATRVDE